MNGTNIIEFAKPVESQPLMVPCEGALYKDGNLDRPDDLYMLVCVNKARWMAVNIKTGNRWINPCGSLPAAVAGLVPVGRRAKLTIEIL